MEARRVECAARKFINWNVHPTACIVGRCTVLVSTVNGKASSVASEETETVGFGSL